MDPKPFSNMAARRAAPDPEAALRLVVDNPEPVPEPIGAPVPGAMAVLALTALLVAVVAMACAIPAAIGDARAWVRRRGQ